MKTGVGVGMGSQSNKVCWQACVSPLLAHSSQHTDTQQGGELLLGTQLSWAGPNPGFPFAACWQQRGKTRGSAAHRDSQSAAAALLPAAARGMGCVPCPLRAVISRVSGGVQAVVWWWVWQYACAKPLVGEATGSDCNRAAAAT